MLAVPLPESELKPKLGQDLGFRGEQPAGDGRGWPKAAIEGLEEELKNATW